MSQTEHVPADDDTARVRTGADAEPAATRPPWEYDAEEEIPMVRGGTGKVTRVLAIVAAVAVGALGGALVRGATPAPAPTIVSQPDELAAADAGAEGAGTGAGAAAIDGEESPAPAAPSAPTSRYSGTVRSVIGDTVYIATRGRGTVKVKVTTATSVVSARRTGPEGVQPGDTIVVEATNPRAPAARVVTGARDLVQHLR